MHFTLHLLKEKEEEDEVIAKGETGKQYDEK
jgi:hypothetical protein